MMNVNVSHNNDKDMLTNEEVRELIVKSQQGDLEARDLSWRKICV